MYSSLNILGIVFLWDWNENGPFPVLWPLLSFPNLLDGEKVETVTDFILGTPKSLQIVAAAMKFSDDPVCKTAKKTQMCITDFWTQRERERERVG